MGKIVEIKIDQSTLPVAGRNLEWQTSEQVWIQGQYDAEEQTFYDPNDSRIFEHCWAVHKWRYI